MVDGGVDGIVLLALLACTAGSKPAPDIVLISLDTTRADAVTSTYAPTISGLEGAHFAWALSHAPTTLNSHATVFTGLDPHGHGVPRNGFSLGSEHTTLATQMAAAGYDTIGVIGASVLGEATSINRGFRVWDARFSADLGRRQERTATEVTDAALADVRQREPGKPLFLFVHFFDAHAPYAAPAPYTRKFGAPDYRGPIGEEKASVEALGRALREGRGDPADVAELRARYRGEVAYVDSEITRLLAGLDNPVVVIFGDHGEALGDDGMNPIGHGGDVDLYAIHVPLVIAGPGVPKTTIERPVRLSDIGPTVLGLAGLPPTLGQGQDLAPLWRGGDVPAVTHFAEATQPIPLAARGRWPNLAFERGAARDGFLLIAQPLLPGSPRLFRLDEAQSPARAADRLGALLQELSTWDAAAPGPVEHTMSTKTREELEALGYSEK